MTTETEPDDSNIASTTETLRQKLIPQASIRSLIMLITASAVVMWIARRMLIGDMFWAKCFGAVLATIALCFVSYAAIFLLSHLFTIATSPLTRAIDARRKDAER